MSSVPFKPQESDISRSLVDNSVLSSVIGSETGDISFVSDLSASYDAKIQVKRDRFLAVCLFVFLLDIVTGLSLFYFSCGALTLLILPPWFSFRSQRLTAYARS